MSQASFADPLWRRDRFRPAILPPSKRSSFPAEAVRRYPRDVRPRESCSPDRGRIESIAEFPASGQARAKRHRRCARLKPGSAKTGKCRLGNRAERLSVRRRLWPSGPTSPSSRHVCGCDRAGSLETASTDGEFSISSTAPVTSLEACFERVQQFLNAVSSTSNPTPPGRTNPRPNRLPQSSAVILRKSPRIRPQ